MQDLIVTSILATIFFITTLVAGLLAFLIWKTYLDIYEYDQAAGEIKKVYSASVATFVSIYHFFGTIIYMV